MIHEEEPENKAQVARSIVIGFAIITITYMVPLLGMMAWLIVGVLGLGCGDLDALQGVRRENPATPRPPREVHDRSRCRAPASRHGGGRADRSASTTGDASAGGPPPARGHGV